jgi:hypothetical protein
MNRPLREIQETQKSTKTLRKTKIKPFNLPRTTFKEQKHKNLIDESKRFNSNRISADSPLRNNSKGQNTVRMATVKYENEPDDISGYNTSTIKQGIMMYSNQKLTEQANFFKFVHTSMPF